MALTTVWSLAQAPDFLRPFAPLPQKFDYGFPRPKSKPSHFSLQSFGSSKSSVKTNLECPVCSVSPPIRTRATISPFGAEAKFTFLRGHVQLFAGFGGTETWKPDGMLQGLGRQVFSGARLSQALGGLSALRPVRPSMSAQWSGVHLLTNDQYNDQWLLQSHIGFRVFLDPQKNISLGYTKGYLYNDFNPLGQTGEWTSTTYDLTFRFGSGPSHFIARQLHKISHRSVVTGK